MKISRENAEHYIWKQVCDGWHLVQTEGLSVIHEKMPPNTAEARHYHEKARQFFFVLSGRAVMELDGALVTLEVSEGVEIPPMIPHQMMNTSEQDTEFLVVSSPTTRGDRIQVE